MAICIACSWNSGTPSVLLQHRLQRLGGIVDRLEPVAPAQVGVHHVALDRARAHDRHLDDEIVEAARLEARQHRHLRSGLSTWNTPTESACDSIS